MSARTDIRDDIETLLVGLGYRLAAGSGPESLVATDSGVGVAVAVDIGDGDGWDATRTVSVTLHAMVLQGPDEWSAWEDAETMAQAIRAAMLGSGVLLGDGRVTDATREDITAGDDAVRVTQTYQLQTAG